MRIFLSVALLAFATATAASPLELPKGLAGLLTPEHVPGGAPGCTRPGDGEALALHAEPGGESPKTGTISFPTFSADPADCGLTYAMFTSVDGQTRRAVPQLESTYEESGLVVLERRSDWLLVDLGVGSGWLERPKHYRFDAYPQMLAERLAYAAPAWTGEICTVAGDECGRIEPSPEQPLRVLGVAEHGGQDWIEVELTNDTCRELEDRVLMRGWIRAHAADGRPAAWFHSRGC